MRTIIKNIYLNTQCYLSRQQLNSDKQKKVIGDDITVIEESSNDVSAKTTVEKILSVYFGLIVADFTEDSELENFIFDYR